MDVPKRRINRVMRMMHFIPHRVFLFAGNLAGAAALSHAARAWVSNALIFSLWAMPKPSSNAAQACFLSLLACASMFRNNACLSPNTPGVCRAKGRKMSVASCRLINACFGSCHCKLARPNIANVKATVGKYTFGLVFASSRRIVSDSW